MDHDIWFTALGFIICGLYIVAVVSISLVYSDVNYLFDVNYTWESKYCVYLIAVLFHHLLASIE